MLKVPMPQIVMNDLLIRSRIGQVIPASVPVDNAFIESFNGRVRDECLDMRTFYINSSYDLIESLNDYSDQFPEVTHISKFAL
jgi:hypothetical protein